MTQFQSLPIFHWDKCSDQVSWRLANQQIITIFKLSRAIVRTNVLIKFHKDWIINVTSRVLTRFHYNHTRKSPPPPGSHVFQQARTIFELIRDIVRTNLLTKFHEDWTINVTSRVLTRFYYTLKPYKENCHAPGGHVFHSTGTISNSSKILLGHMFWPSFMNIGLKMWLLEC